MIERVVVSMKMRIPSGDTLENNGFVYCQSIGLDYADY